MTKGMIYLIQPVELVGTKRYKVGLSNEPTLDRCRKGYKNGSRYLLIMECDDSLRLENTIKREFKKKYKLIAGSEYFEGNEREMLRDFVKMVMDHKFIDNDHTTNNPTGKKICDDNISCFIDEFYEITGNKNDYVSKYDFVSLYRCYHCKKFDLCYIISCVKSLCIEYDGSKRINGKTGFFLGIREL